MGQLTDLLSFFFVFNCRQYIEYNFHKPKWPDTHTSGTCLCRILGITRFFFSFLLFGSGSFEWMGWLYGNGRVCEWASKWDEREHWRCADGRMGNRWRPLAADFGPHVDSSWARCMSKWARCTVYCEYITESMEWIGMWSASAQRQNLYIF